LALGISAACHGETYPAPIGPSQSDFGGVGLLQTPTARMAREGEMSLNYRDNDQYRYYSASVQLFPWLETTLRYTDVRTKQYSSVESFSGDQTYKDKAFDLKLRLWEESYWMPQVAVGARDIGGTGLFDAEYIVANKAWGPFDFSLGLGWGYLGTSGNVSNPFCSYSDKFCHRDNSYKQAGSIDGSQMFHGPASLFGGVEYQTPWQPLRLKLEYEIITSRILRASWIRRASLTSALFIASPIGPTLTSAMSAATPLCLGSRCGLTLTICDQTITTTPARNISHSRRMPSCNIRWWRIS
jgi:hypothetical protein